MTKLKQDILINVFNNKIAIADTYMFMVDGSLTLSERSKKYFLSDYAESKGEEYNDFNFTILGMYYEFKKHIFHMNFVLGSVNLFHEVTL